MLPTSYESSNEELDALEDRFLNEDYEFIPKQAIQYARTIDNDTQLDKFMEALEDLGTFPFLPYDNDSHILDYFTDVGYNIAEVARFLSLIDTQDLKIDYMTEYYRLVPIRAGQTQATALTTYNKAQVIRDLRMYQRYPDTDLIIKESTISIDDIAPVLKHHSKAYNNHVSGMLMAASHYHQPLFHIQRILKESYPEYFNNF